VKASFQIAAWEERWNRLVQFRRVKQSRHDAILEKEHFIAIAQQQTEQARAELEQLQAILARTLELDPFDWSSFKDLSTFTDPCPQGPTPKALPTVPEEQSFAPTLSFLETLLPPFRKRKQDAAAAKFQLAYSAWQTESARVQSLNKQNERRFQEEMDDWLGQKAEFDEKQAERNAHVDSQRISYHASDPDTLIWYWYEVLSSLVCRAEWPDEVSVNYLEETKTIVVDYELPNIEMIPELKEVKYVASRAEFKETFISDAQVKKLYDDVLFQIALSALYRLFDTDKVDAIAAVVWNGWVRSIDKATGTEVHPCIMSVQATTEEFTTINLRQVDPRLCFKKLKGICGSKLTELSPVKPILLLSKDDSRFVPAYNVADAIDDRTNLAEMDWLDFENLIREIFEKEFSRDGGEVKITQASRDGGVDAIAFDPDPIRGGKVVIQAKRYTNAVGVSAVRDLYGTVHNEGATKGLLVTTSDFGPDAYEFAKGKPLTLLSGSELLYLLQKHGYRAKIDIAAAKQAFAADPTRSIRGNLRSPSKTAYKESCPNSAE
jgi:restriction system protein